LREDRQTLACNGLVGKPFALTLPEQLTTVARTNGHKPMRDRNLERNIKRLEALVENWKEFSQFLDRGFQQQEIAPADEAAFLELKSQIAREFETLMTMLAGLTERDDRLLRMLNAVTSLAGIKDLPEGTATKLAADWHHTFIAWQALLGRLRGRQAQLAAQNSLTVALRRLLMHPVTLIVMFLAAAYGLYRLADDWLPQLMLFIDYLENKP